MKTIMKRCIALLVALSLLTLSSCSTIASYLDDYSLLDSAVKPDTEFRITADLVYEFDEQIPLQIEERFEKMEELLKANNVVRAIPFLLLFSAQAQDMFYVADHANLCNIRYYANPEDSAAMDEYLRLNQLYTDYSSRLLSMYRPIYESNYRHFFFGSLSKSDRKRILALADSFSGEVARITKERNDLISEYRSLSFEDQDFLFESGRIYEQIVKKNREIALLSDYDSYPDYAYDVVYSRDYTPEQAKKMHGYVKDYVVPMAKDLYEEIGAFAAKDPEGAKALEQEMSALFGKELTTSTANGELSDYYSLQYWDADSFIDKWENHSIFGDEESYPIAFTTYLRYYDFTLCYFGEGYQTISTCIHEQGHFAAFLETTGGYTSMDLNEVHSQGNEWLYYSYLGSLYEEDSSTYDMIVKSQAYEHFLNIIISTACDMFEQRVYADESLTYDQYDRVFDECVEELGATTILENSMSMKPSEYWHMAIIANSLYYLSYAVSLIPSIELYVIAQDQGLEEAADRYLALTEGSSDVTFGKALGDAELSSPFDEGVYIVLSQYFSRTAE
ncbi:MAG: hypothetical protein IJZ33_04470 [Clostridia bacterium]|nr:hypothetical protein [Clostridia bacterium]